MVVTIDSKFYSKLQLGISKYQEKTPADPLNNTVFSDQLPALVYVAVYFRAIFMYTPIFLCFQVLKGPKNAKISAADFWKVGKVNFWPL